LSPSVLVLNERPIETCIRVNETVLIETDESYLRIEYWPYLILTKPACMVMGATFLNYSQALSLINVGVGFSNTPPHAQHYWAWCVDINGGWSETIASDAMLDSHRIVI
jgi:hypothetical protein